jgi:NADPH:quinone reductase
MKMEQGVVNLGNRLFDMSMVINGETAKGLWCTSIGESEIRSTPVTANAGEELVEVIICDVSPLDLQVAEGRFPPGPPMPVIPGTTGVVRDAAGKLYFAFVEMRGGGLFSPGIHRTVASVSRDVMFEIPKGVDYKNVAAGFTGIITALAVLDHAMNVKKGQNILILGANRGVGSAAVEVALARGARVIACARQPINIPGVDYVSYDDLPAKVMEITDGKGVNGIIDGIGGEISNKALMCGGLDCKHILLGFSAGIQLPLIAPRFLGTEHQLIGFNLLRRPWPLIAKLMDEAMEFLKDGKCIPIIAQEVAFEKAPEAFKTAASKQGRTLLVMQEL